MAKGTFDVDQGLLLAATAALSSVGDADGWIHEHISAPASVLFVHDLERPFMCILVGVVLAATSAIIWLLASAGGQVLLAILDTAVNTSPLLTPERKEQIFRGEWTKAAEVQPAS